MPTTFHRDPPTVARLNHNARVRKGVRKTQPPQPPRKRGSAHPAQICTATAHTFHQLLVCRLPMARKGPGRHSRLSFGKMLVHQAILTSTGHPVPFDTKACTQMWSTSGGTHIKKGTSRTLSHALCVGRRCRGTSRIAILISALLQFLDQGPQLVQLISQLRLALAPVP